MARVRRAPPRTDDFPQKGRTAEQISADGGHAAVTELLGRERLDAPAQEIEVREYRSQDRAVTISFWIGDEVSCKNNCDATVAG